MNIKELLDRFNLLEDYEYVYQNKNLDAHKKLESGYNQFYNPNGNGTYGTFMDRKITSGVGQRSISSNGQCGLDLAYNFNEPVYAFNDEIANVYSVLRGFGRTVIIIDKNGYKHVYGHLAEIKIKNGQKISKGDLIGLAGNSATDNNGKLIDKKDNPHLHYGIWDKGNVWSDKVAIDPRLYQYP